MRYVAMAIVLVMPAAALASRVETRADDSQPLSYLVVRYDDYAPAVHYPRSTGDASLEERLFQLFQRESAVLCAGVIPFPIADQSSPRRDPEAANSDESWLHDASNRWTMLLRKYVDAGVVEPALHGFEHRRNTRPGDRPGEFRGMTAGAQRAAIRVGRSALDLALDQTTTVFVPPWNSWDQYTARALFESGFTWLSADLHRGEPGVALGMMPQTSFDPAALLEWIKKNEIEVSGAVAVLVTHPFDFEGPRGEEYFASLERLLVYVRKSPYWRSVGFTGLPANLAEESQARVRAAIALSHAGELVGDLPLARRWAPRSAPAILAAGEYQVAMTRSRIVFACAVMAVALAAGCVSALARWVLRERPRTRCAGGWIILAASAFLMLGALSIAAHDYRIRGARWISIAAALGALAPLTGDLLRAARPAPLTRRRELAPAGRA